MKDKHIIMTEHELDELFNKIRKIDSESSLAASIFVLKLALIFGPILIIYSLIFKHI